MSDENLEFRFVTSDDVDSICELYAEAFPQAYPLNCNYYRWYYFENDVLPFSSVVAIQNGKLAAHAGFSGRRCKLRGKDGLLYLKQDSMSATFARGKGVYSRLLTWANEQTENKGVSLILSYPNANNHPVQIMRPDYRDVYQIPALSRNFTDAVVSDNVLDSIPPGRLLKGESDPFPALNYETLCSLVSSRIFFGIDCSPEYLTWRFAKHPDVDYYALENFEGGRLRSAVVYKLYPQIQPKKIMVVYWLRDDEDSKASDVFEPLEEFAAKCNFEIALWQNVFQKTAYKSLERRGYRLSTPIIYFGAFPIGNAEVTKGFECFANWNVNMSDVDIF